MVIPQGRPENLQRLPVERLRILIPARIRQKGGEVVEPNGVIWMPFAQSLPTDLQRLPVEWLRLLIPARNPQKGGEVVETSGVIGPFAQGFPADLQRLPEERLRLFIPARIRQKVGEVAEPNGRNADAVRPRSPDRSPAPAGRAAPPLHTGPCPTEDWRGC